MRLPLVALVVIAFTAACDQAATDSHGAQRIVESRTITAAEIATAAQRSLPFQLDPSAEWSFSGSFDTPKAVEELPVDRVRNAVAQVRLSTSITELGAVADVTLRGGDKQCVLARNLHVGDTHPVELHWDAACTRIFFAPDRTLTVDVTATNSQQRLIQGSDWIKLDVQAVVVFQ